MLQQSNPTVKHPTFKVEQEIVDLISPFDLGMMDAEDGERCQPEAYFVQFVQIRAYRAGYRMMQETMADARYPESNEITYNAYMDIVR